MKLILFDCDGTLVDSAANIHRAMEQTFVHAGLPAPEIERTREVIGLSLDHAIAKLLDRPCDDQTAALADEYRKHFLAQRNEAAFHEPLFDGIAGLVESLGQRDDVVLGIVTGKSRRGIRSVFATHGFGHHFITVRTADDCPSKPHPAMVLECCDETGVDPAHTAVIGDTVYDMQMARSAGAQAIGVSWGYHAASALRDAGAHHIAVNAGNVADFAAEWI